MLFSPRARNDSEFVAFNMMDEWVLGRKAKVEKDAASIAPDARLYAKRMAVESVHLTAFVAIHELREYYEPCSITTSVQAAFHNRVGHRFGRKDREVLESRLAGYSEITNGARHPHWGEVYPLAKQFAKYVGQDMNALIIIFGGVEYSGMRDYILGMLSDRGIERMANSFHTPKSLVDIGETYKTAEPVLPASKIKPRIPPEYPGFAKSPERADDLIWIDPKLVPKMKALTALWDEIVVPKKHLPPG